ncbi:MAG: hypothetical protein ACE5NA_06185 [Nitrospiraceae bacterium]
MPYVFPNEDLFVGAIGLLIVALLIYRVAIARRRRRNATRSDGAKS